MLPGLVFAVAAMFALWVVGVTSGVIRQVAQVVSPDIARAINPGKAQMVTARVAQPKVERTKVAQAAPAGSAQAGAADAQANSRATASTRTDPAQQAMAMAAYGKIPLYFIQNEGQAGDSKFKFYEQGSTHATYFAADGVTMVLSKYIPRPDASADSPPFASHSRTTETIKLSAINSSANTAIVAEAKQPGVVNYYIGNDPSSWKTGLETYQSVRYSEMYPGVDVRYYGNNSQLVYDVIVKPGADPS